jgi:hypothetical protein
VLSTGRLTLYQPFSVAVDGAGDLYIADTGNNRVVEVTAAGVASVLSTGGLTLSHPFGVAVDGAGDVYIADANNSRVVEVTTTGTASVLSTGGLTLNQPFSVAVDGAGDLYITDTGNNRVVEVTAAGTASVLSTGGLTLAEPFSVAVDGAGDLYIADYGNSRVVKINQASQALSFTSTGTGDSSAQQTMTVENIGNQPLNFTALNITTTGLTTSIFDLNGPTTCTDSTSLVAGAACNLGVEFAPTTPGNFTGTVNITDNNAAGAVQQATLSGTGTGYAASILLSENPSSSVTYGTPVTVTATLSGSNGTPIGNITYTLDGVMQPSVALSPTSGNGVASFTLPGTLSVGTHSVLVNYAGDNNYTESTLESSFNLTVNAVATTTTLAQPSSSTITAGGSVTLTATVVVGSTPVTSGTVTFASGTTSIGAAQLNASGVATLTTTTLPVGTDSITASFVDTANDAASNSTPAVTVTVNAATGPGAAAITTTTLTALPSTITAGSGVTLTATVSVGTTPVTSGTVTFSSGSTSIGAAQLNSTGNAVLTTTILPTGSDSITASFVGTANDAASNSTPLTITVNAAPPATNASYFITASPTSLSIAQGQTGTTTLTLTPTGGYTGTLVLSCGNLPSYVTCTFSQGGATNNTVTLGSSGQSGSVILTIQTNVATARLEAMPAFRPASPQTPSSPLLPAMLIGWPGGLAGVVVAFKRRRKGAKQPVRLMPLCLLVLLTGAMAVGLSGCGGSNMMTSTPMGVSTIVVTATSTTSSGQTSGASQSLPLTITISQ